MDENDRLRDLLNKPRLLIMEKIDKLFKICEYTLIIGVIFYVGIESEVEILWVFGIILSIFLGFYSFLFITTLHPYYIEQGDTSEAMSWILWAIAMATLGFEALIIVGIVTTMSKGIGI